VRDGYVDVARAAVARAAEPFDDPNGCVDPLTRAKLAGIPDSGITATPAALATREARTREALEMGQANLKRVRDAGLPIAMGTDAGNPGTLHGPSVYAEMEAMQASGMTAGEVLVSATKGGSRAMGREKEIGTVEKGKLADLLILNADPTRSIANARRIKGVVRGGVYRSIEELRATIAAEGESPAAKKP
jgi:imidazolonepropionase-like amidohydrolase